MKVETLDYDEPMELLVAAVEAFGSEREIRKLVNRTQGGKRAKFRNRNWIHSYVPFGYAKNEDGWLAVEGGKIEVVESIFEEFVRTKNYTETAKIINSRFGDRLDGELKRHHIKSVVTNPVYVGSPSYGDEVQVEDESLKIIDEETFSEAQEAVEKIREKSLGGENEYLDGKIKELGFGYLSRKTDIAAVCKECDSVMVKSGSRVKYGVKVGQYKCPECGHQSTVPLGAHLREIEGRKLISCPYCRVTENFVVDQALSGRYRYQCKSCGGVFFSKANPDKYLREYPSEGEGDE